MSQIFINHSHKDKQFAAWLSESLRDKGYDAWIDAVNIDGGDLWEEGIKTAIKESEVLVVVTSPHIHESRWVQREIALAELQDKIIIPILIEGQHSEILPELQKFQVIDFRKNQDDALAKLLETKNLPEPANKSFAIEKLIKRGNAFFGDLADYWPDVEDFGDGDADPVGLLIARSLTTKVYLVGRRNDQLKRPSDIQVGLHFSGAKSRPFVELVADYVAAHEQRLWMVLLRGPVNDEGYYYLPDDNPPAWEDAAKMTWKAIDLVSQRNEPLHFFLNTANALSFAIALKHREMRPICLYNFSRSSEPENFYVKVYG